MTELPPGWAWSALGDLVDVLDSRRVPVNARERGARAGAVPYYGATGRVGWIDTALFDEHLVLLGEDGVRFFEPHARKAYAIHGPAWVNNHAHVLRATRLDRRYLVHYLNGFDYAGYANGTTRPKLTQAAMARIPVAVPPLAEQHRVVAALDGYLARVDTGVRALHQAARGIECLSDRLAGDLVGTDGTVVELGDIADIRNGIFVSRAGTEPDGVPILRVGAVRRREVDTTDLRFSGFTEGELAARNGLLAEGDVLFTRYNGNPEYVGECGVVGGAVSPLAYPDKLIRARVDGSVAVPRFLALACSVPPVRDDIRARVRTTAGQAGIAGAALRELRLALPSVAEQENRVARFDRLDRALRRQDVVAQDAVARAAGLRRALLGAAIAGRLAR